MNQQERGALRNQMLELNKNRTHYKDCSKTHLTCRIIRTIDDYEQETEVRNNHVARITDYVPYCYVCETEWPCGMIRSEDFDEKMIDLIDIMKEQGAPE
jgi:hypothetical protein